MVGKRKGETKLWETGGGKFEFISVFCTRAQTTSWTWRRRTCQPGFFNLIDIESKKRRMSMQNFILVYRSTVAKSFLFFLLLCCLSHSLPQFRHRFWPKFWAELAEPKFGLPEKIPSPREPRRLVGLLLLRNRHRLSLPPTNDGIVTKDGGKGGVG